MLTHRSPSEFENLSDSKKGQLAVSAVSNRNLLRALAAAATSTDNCRSTETLQTKLERVLVCNIVCVSKRNDRLAYILAPLE